MRTVSNRQLNRLVRLACEKLDIDRAHVMGKYRARPAVHARWLIWRVLRMHYGLPHYLIAEHFNTDHHTIIYGIKNWNKATRRDEQLPLVYQVVVGLICDAEGHPVFTRGNARPIQLFGIQEGWA